MDHKMFIIVVVAIYFVVLLGIGFFTRNKNNEVDDFLVAGRNVGLVVGGFSIASVQIGAGIIVGGATDGSQFGVWPGMYYAMGCGLGCIIAGIFIAGRMREVEGVVPMDYFEARFGKYKVVRGWAWLSNVPSMLGIFISQLLACGSILSAFGLPFSGSVIICAVVILVSAVMGGMWSVAIGNTIQIIIIMVGIPVAAIAALVTLNNNGVPVGEVFAIPFIPDGLFSKFIYKVTPMLVSISVSYDAFLRYQAAKDVKTAKGACILGGVITIVVGFAASLVGAAGQAVFPGSDHSSIFAFTVSELLNPVLAAVVVTAVLAAAMSSGSGLLIGLGGSFSADLYRGVMHPDKEMSELPKAKVIAKVTVVVACIVGVLLSFKIDNLLDAIILFNYPYMGSVLVPLLGAVFYKGATVKGCFAAMGVGAVIGTGAFIGSFIGMNADLGLFVAYLGSLIALVAVSSFDSKKCPMITKRSKQV